MAITKKFDPKLHKKYDKLARNATKKLFEKIKGYEIQDNPKAVGVDFLVYKNGEHVGYCEVEVKGVWSGAEFPFQSVQIPKRKFKYTQLDKNTLFIMYNKDQTKYLAIKGKDLAEAPVAMVRNKFIKYGEEFFQVDLNKITMNNIESLLKDFGG